MTEKEFEECEQAERQKHDEKVKELEEESKPREKQIEELEEEYEDDEFELCIQQFLTYCKSLLDE